MVIGEGEGVRNDESNCSVIAGLDPAIHPLKENLFTRMDGYAGQARV
jgi:hypothetical protein